MNSSEPRSGAHLDDTLGDFVLGRLTAFEHQRWVDHLASCAACREQVALAQSMREDGVHLGADRIVEIADDASTVRTDEAAHLDACEQCSGEIAKMRMLEAPLDLVLAEDVTRRTLGPRRTTAPRSSRRRASIPMALFAVAAALVVVFLPRGDEQGLMRGFAQIDPLPVRITRAAAEPGSMDEARLLGLEAYRDAQWTHAVEQLTTARIRGGGAEVGLYLASSHLQLDRDELALAELDRVLADSTANAGLLDEARWLRVQLALRAEDPASVERWLRAIEAAEGRRAPDARALRDRMGKSGS